MVVMTARTQMKVVGVIVITTGVGDVWGFFFVGDGLSLRFGYVSILL